MIEIPEVFECFWKKGALSGSMQGIRATKLGGRHLQVTTDHCTGHGSPSKSKPTSQKCKRLSTNKNMNKKAPSPMVLHDSEKPSLLPQHTQPFDVNLLNERTNDVPPVPPVCRPLGLTNSPSKFQRTSSCWRRMGGLMRSGSVSLVEWLWLCNSLGLVWISHFLYFLGG